MQRKSWANISDGSTLVAQVASADDFTAAGRVAIDGSVIRNLSTDDLTNGVELPLRSPHIMVLEIDVFLNGNATVTVTGSVNDPAGNAFATPFAGTVTGVNGDHDTILLSGITAL
jgi:hypothetical protein